MPAEIAEKYQNSLDNGEYGFAFAFPSGDRLEDLMIQLAPLIGKGRIIPQPTRQLFCVDPTKTVDGRRTWEGIEAKLDSRLDAWHLQKDTPPNHSPIISESVFSANFREENITDIMTEIAIPFINNVSFEDFSMIVEDHSDILFDFRKELRKISQNYDFSQSLTHNYLF